MQYVVFVLLKNLCNHSMASSLVWMFMKTVQEKACSGAPMKFSTLIFIYFTNILYSSGNTFLRESLRSENDVKQCSETSMLHFPFFTTFGPSFSLKGSGENLSSGNRCSGGEVADSSGGLGGEEAGLGTCDGGDLERANLGICNAGWGEIAGLSTCNVCWREVDGLGTCSGGLWSGRDLEIACWGTCNAGWGKVASLHPWSGSSGEEVGTCNRGSRKEVAVLWKVIDGFICGSKGIFTCNGVACNGWLIWDILCCNWSREEEGIMILGGDGGGDVAGLFTEGDLTEVMDRLRFWEGRSGLFTVNDVAHTFAYVDTSYIFLFFVLRDKILYSWCVFLYILYQLLLF